MNTNPQIKLIGLRIFYFKQAIRPLGGYPLRYRNHAKTKSIVYGNHSLNLRNQKSSCCILKTIQYHQIPLNPQPIAHIRYRLRIYNF
ncbi:unknown [Prevotella sp. CAG:592]|nr:unknown [Prevotella sp. CAG:592]